MLAADSELGDADGEPARFVVNPLVNWIWFGFGVLALGTGIALLPERAVLVRAREAAGARRRRRPSRCCLRCCSRRRVAVGAGHDRRAPTRRRRSTPRTPFEKQLQHEIVCTCGACGHTTIAECRKDPCATSHKMRGELAALIDQGKTHDEIIQAFVASYGSQEMLGAPIDKGFNRLAWLFPYARRRAARSRSASRR